MSHNPDERHPNMVSKKNNHISIMSTYTYNHPVRLLNG